MKIIDILKFSEKPTFSLELLPPIKGDSIKNIYTTIDDLIEFNPKFISITYHKEEVVLKNRIDGLVDKFIVKKRPGTVGISSAIKFKYDIEVLPHMICRGFNKEDTENALIDLHYLGFDNLFVVRGDENSNQDLLPIEINTHIHADSLVKQITDLNKGIYTAPIIENQAATNFSVGVAAYPEKHLESPNMDYEMKFLKHKIDIGAEFIITQMVFDNTIFYKFLELCDLYDIRVPIIPGIKPIVSKKQMTLLPQKFFVNIPNDLVNKIQICKNDQEVQKIGTEWAISQSKDLINNGIKHIHYFTMGKSSQIKQIVHASFF